MKKTIQWMTFVVAMVAMMTACDVQNTSPADLEGLWGGGKIASKNGDIEMIIRFTPNQADSTQGEFAMWYEGTWNDEDDAGKFSQGFSVSVPGTYKVNDDEVVLTYNSDEVGVKLDDDDAIEHAKALQEAGEEGSVEAIAQDFKDMFGDFLGESFQSMFKTRNNGENVYGYAVKDGKLTLSTSDVDNVVLKKIEE